MSDYPMLISNKLHSFRNFVQQKYNIYIVPQKIDEAHSCILEFIRIRRIFAP